MSDVFVKGGTLPDGTTADIDIKRDRIAAMERIGAEAARLISATCDLDLPFRRSAGQVGRHTQPWPARLHRLGLKGVASGASSARLQRLKTCSRAPIAIARVQRRWAR